MSEGVGRFKCTLDRALSGLLFQNNHPVDEYLMGTLSVPELREAVLKAPAGPWRGERW